MQERLRLPAATGLSLLTIVAGGVVAAPAQAAGTGVASVVSSVQVRYKAGSGTTNRVVVTRSGNTVTIDDRVRIKAGKGCKAVKGDKTRVRCTTRGRLGAVNVRLYGGNDSAVNRTSLVMVADGGSGNDRLTGGSRRDVLTGGTGRDKLFGLGGDDRLSGGSGADEVRGGDGYDNLWGGTGNDLLDGGAGPDFLHGQAGDDRIDGGSGDDHLRGEAGNDRLHGGADTDLLYGGPGADDLQGGLGNDALHGDNPNEGPVAADVLAGGPGSDSVSYRYYSKPVRVALDGTRGDDGQAGERDTVGGDIENLTGGAGDDVLTGNDRRNIINGGEGDDTIRGLDDADVLYAYDGQDVVHGDGGDDEIFTREEENEVANAADQVDAGAHGTLGDYCVTGALDVVAGCER